MGVELRISTEPSPTRSGGPPAVMSTLHDALAFILCQRAQEGDEAPANWCSEVQVRFIQDLQKGSASVDALDDRHAVEHAPRGAVPLRDNQNAARPQRIDRLFELRPVLRVLPLTFSLKMTSQPSDRRAADLPIKVLAGCREPEHSRFFAFDFAPIYCP